ncbi:MAG: hypothetical protein ACPF9D_12460 [Owenweeksia sp.]
MKKMPTLNIGKKDVSAQNFTASQFFAVLNFNESQRRHFQSDLGIADSFK